jgi:tetratricopeptide (TPR) repeat protein
VAWSQGKPTGGGGGGGGTGAPSRTGPSKPTIPSLPTMNPIPEMNRPIYLTGKVVLDRGSELPEPVPIQRVCGSTVRREGYTDMHGGFSILLGDTTTFQDASESGSMAGRKPSFNRAQLWGCEIRAMLAGYTSSSISLAGRDLNDTSSIGTIVLQKIGGVEGNSISVISLKAPDKARREYEKGMESFDKKKYPDAEKHLAIAVGLYPQYASAWDLRGREQLQQQQVDEAFKSFEAAITADEKYVPPYIRLAAMQAGKNNWQEVVRLTNRAVQLDPQSYPDAYFLNGAAQYNLHKFAEAERSAMKAVELDKEHRFPRAEFLLGNILQLKGDSAGAVLHLQAYLRLDPNSADGPAIQTYIAKQEQKASAEAGPKPKP